jgi:hypothetical protein
LNKFYLLNLKFALGYWIIIASIKYTNTKDSLPDKTEEKSNIFVFLPGILSLIGISM